MSGVLLIGYGNPLRGDDGVGWRVARWFEENADDPELQVIICHQLTPDLADDLSRVRLAVFVDAREDGEPGTIRCEPVRAQADVPSTFSHHVEPSLLLAIAEQTFHSAPRASLFTICGESFDYSENLSPRIESLIPEVVSMIQEWIRENNEGENRHSQT